ncbi:hypothetical protein [Bradyrhizobium lablabi]|uniref:hypothetical protein n=1 Tax=Bradyrhizobium lablabi TaxID=722472 RepID=UPI001BADAC83|nr:hypothetical protein [Bradyrhizobium lablabi]MBR0694808.1 hypothetical protein [Bradyrhizobium lablabi]
MHQFSAKQFLSVKVNAANFTDFIQSWKSLTRRANHWHNTTIAKLLMARAEKSAAGFFFAFFRSDGGRTSRRCISPRPPPERRKRAAVRTR